MHCASLERPHHEKTRGRFSDDRERGSIVCRKHHLFAGILTFLPAAIVASDTPSRERGRRVRHAFADYHPRENFVKRQIPRSLMSRKSDLGVFFPVQRPSHCLRSLPSSVWRSKTARILLQDWRS